MAQSKRYTVLIAPTADTRYTEVILPYLARNFSFERVVEIDRLIGEMVLSLATFPDRGRSEPIVPFNGKPLRSVIFNQTRIFQLKIIYHVNEADGQVAVVDFFPTAMDPDSMLIPE
jgi:hypothetical protein